MSYTSRTLRKGGYTWQFDKSALKEYFDTVIAEAEKQKKWTKQQWIDIAIQASDMLALQQEALKSERKNVKDAVAIAGYAAERGAAKARPTATDTKARLRDFGTATRELQYRTNKIGSKDIEKLNTILHGERVNDYK